MKFIVDSMLGKLAKRLRLMGYDTYYDPKADDREILRLSKEEDRFIVTRDSQMAKIRGAKVFLIKSTDLMIQLKEISKLAKIRPESGKSFSRCPECNTPVKDVSKEEVKKIVPKFVYETLNKFSYCPKCKKAYWQGTHYQKLLKEQKNI
jgi:uncharacterized protein with PIN domain